MDQSFKVGYTEDLCSITQGLQSKGLPCSLHLTSNLAFQVFRLFTTLTYAKSKGAANTTSKQTSIQTSIACAYDTGGSVCHIPELCVVRVLQGKLELQPVLRLCQPGEYNKEYAWNDFILNVFWR